MTADPAAGLWDWAVAVYVRPGVEDALLRLQDERGADVALVLWRLWLAAADRRPTADALARARALGAAWRGEVVAPLRAARRALKTPADGIDAPEAAALRTRVSELELAAEKLQLAALEGLAFVRGEAGDPIAALRALDGLESAPEVELSTLIKALGSR